MPGRWLLPHWVWLIGGGVLTLGAVLFSSAVATFPGEWQEERLSKWRFAPVSHASDPANEKLSEPQRMSSADWTATLQDWAASSGNWVLTKEASLHDRLFNAAPDPITGRRLPFSSTLVLPGLNVYEGLGIDDPEKIKGRDFVFRARGRDLKGAILALAIVPKVDFEGADLEDASLDRAQLQGASLQWRAASGRIALWRAASGRVAPIGARLQGASLNGAQLQGASLDGAPAPGRIALWRAASGRVTPIARWP